MGVWGGRIVFGHGRNASLAKNGYESDKPWFNETKQEVAQVLGVFHKPVDDILEHNRATLEGYGYVDSIVVIGHSVNEIDLPYFQFILDAYPDANWQNYNYENIDEGIDEVSEIHDKLLVLGIPEERLKSYSSEKLKIFYPVQSL